MGIIFPILKVSLSKHKFRYLSFAIKMEQSSTNNNNEIIVSHGHDKWWSLISLSRATHSIQNVKVNKRQCPTMCEIKVEELLLAPRKNTTIDAEWRTLSAPSICSQKLIGNIQGGSIWVPCPHMTCTNVSPIGRHKS